MRSDRLRPALRLLTGAGLGTLALGLLDWGAHLPVLTATVAPTIYVFVAHPGSESARLRNAAIGHAVAVIVGIVLIAAFGLWDARSAIGRGHLTLAQALTAGIGVGLTLFILELLGSHHAPAASSVLLITTGLARPGRPLVGLVLGLALVLAASPLLVRAPPAMEPHTH